MFGVFIITFWTLQWRHNARDGVSNQQPYDCLLNHLFRRRSKKTPRLRVTDHCAGNLPGTGEFPAQRASNTENVIIWWRHHDLWEYHAKCVPGRQITNWALKQNRRKCGSRCSILSLGTLSEICFICTKHVYWYQYKPGLKLYVNMIYTDEADFTIPSDNILHLVSHLQVIYHSHQIVFQRLVVNFVWC